MRCSIYWLLLPSAFVFFVDDMVSRAYTRADFSVSARDLQDELHEFMQEPENLGKPLSQVLAPLANVTRDNVINGQGWNIELHPRICTNKFTL